MRISVFALVALCVVFSSDPSSAGAPDAPDSTGTPNIVVVFLDETGTDCLEMYGGAMGLNPYSGSTDPTNGEGNLYINSPTLDWLADNGIKFTSAYAQPRCSPSRASLLSGVYPTNHGVGNILVNPSNSPVNPNPRPVGALTDFDDLDFDVEPLPELLGNGLPSYSTGVFGTWHLAMPTPDMSPTYGEWCYMGWPSIWERGKFDAWACVFNGVDNEPSPEITSNFCPGFYNFYLHRGEGTQGAQEQVVGQYATCVPFGDALDWCNTAATEPFFCLISPNAAHSPHHYLPPTGPPSDELCEGMVQTDEYKAAVDYNAFTRFCASFEAIGKALGYFLDHMDAERKLRTLFIVMGDNGTPEPILEHARRAFGSHVQATDCRRAQEILGSDKDLGPTYDFVLGSEGSDKDGRFKGTVYEKGVRVPLIVYGAGVMNPGRESRALVQVEDVFATVAELARKTPAEPVNGISFKPVLDDMDPQGETTRDVVFSQIFNPTGHSGPGTALDDHYIGCSLKIDGRNPGRFKIVRNVKEDTDEFYWLEDENGDDVDRWEEAPLGTAFGDTFYDEYLAVRAEIDLVMSEATTGPTCLAGSNFCDPVPNSIPAVAEISMSGTTRVDCNELVLHYTGTIPERTAQFFYGKNELDPPGSLGHGRLCICVSGPQPCGVFRMGMFTTAPCPSESPTPCPSSGSFAVDLTSLPPAGPISAGDTWFFQLWYRDPDSTLGSNLSDALELTFCP